MQVTGEREENIMNKKRSDENAPIGKMTQVTDFLPPPSELIQLVETVKVTIVLNRSSDEFFKKEAQKHHSKYQKMIREVLDRYASHFNTATKPTQ